MSARIPLRNRVGIVDYALVDDDDAGRIGQYRWHFAHAGRYAHAMVRLPDGRKTTAYMHRMVLDIERGDRRHVDHINRDTLDNRRENLRVLTQRQNSQNVAGRPDLTSPYRGVCFDKAAGCWRAYAKLNGQGHHLGRFAEELDAARVAHAFRAQHMPFTVEDPRLVEAFA